jgi:hypothetical protein
VAGCPGAVPDRLIRQNPGRVDVLDHPGSLIMGLGRDNQGITAH